MDVPEAARRPHIVSLSLKLRDGHVLNGAVTARVERSDTIPAYNVSSAAGGPTGVTRVEKEAFLLTQWAELQKR